MATLKMQFAILMNFRLFTPSERALSANLLCFHLKEREFRLNYGHGSLRHLLLKIIREPPVEAF